jgi:RluA family pseudouridine synthase
MPLPAVVFEDEVLLAFDKPGGLPVASRGGEGVSESLAGLVQAEYGRNVANVHRLDPDASGVVLFARTKAALDCLSGQFQAKTAEIVYLALVTGAPSESAFKIENSLADDKARPGRLLIVAKGGRPAVTTFRVLERFRGFAWLECRPQPCRLHQIRVHLATLGLSVLNDSLYGNDAKLLLSSLKRGYKGRDHEQPLIRCLALHASQLTVMHPVTKERVTIQASLTNELEVALKYLHRFGGEGRRTSSALAQRTPASLADVNEGN